MLNKWPPYLSIKWSDVGRLGQAVRFFALRFWYRFFVHARFFGPPIPLGTGHKLGLIGKTRSPPCPSLETLAMLWTFSLASFVCHAAFTVSCECQQYGGSANSPSAEVRELPHRARVSHRH